MPDPTWLTTTRPSKVTTKFIAEPRPGSRSSALLYGATTPSHRPNNALARVDSSLRAAGPNPGFPGVPRAFEATGSPAQQSRVRQSPSLPNVPPTYRPEVRKIVQPKTVSQSRTAGAAPAVYRPDQQPVGRPGIKGLLPRSIVRSRTRFECRQSSLLPWRGSWK
jgi:hypothetical protein